MMKARIIGGRAGGIDLDRKYGILSFIENGYEPFHLTGTQGVVDEIVDCIRIRREHDIMLNKL